MTLPNQNVAAVTPSEAGTFIKRGDRMREINTDNDSNGLTRQNQNGARENYFVPSSHHKNGAGAYGNDIVSTKQHIEI